MKKKYGLSIAMGIVFAIVFWRIFHNWILAMVMGVVFFVVFRSLNVFGSRKD